ncbi:phage terminase large subunit [Vibrio maritimus]|uniref:Phage terminase large subunit n=1 Tax=Vibrio maritimus TaxID=990268 RepID=A0A090RT05_9VIBR|nr:phage terminase large subunit [Vibrio maritimus]
MDVLLQKAFNYADQVLDGDIVAGDLTIKAIERWHSDLKRAKKPDAKIRFNPGKALKALRFFSLLPHVKGPMAGQPIDLMPWQAFAVANLFGWEMKREGIWTRRFRKSYMEVARKNAKSTLLSGLCLFATGIDNDDYGEVYSAATTRDQAGICYGDAVTMVKKSPPLSHLFKCLKTEIQDRGGNGLFRALSSDAHTLDGRNPSFSVVDEYHAHRTSDLYDVIESGMGARLNPGLHIITTAGFNLTGPCYVLRKQYIEPLLNGTIEDDSYFALVYTLDEDDDPFDEENWIKANPSLGVSKHVDTMREEAKKARYMPSARNNFLTKHCNVWVNASSSFIDLREWEKCPASLPDEHLARVPCYIGVDLARLWDLTAVVALFKVPDGTYDLRVRMYLPEDSMEKIPKALKEMYERFVKDGDLILTPGNVVDHEIIRDEIMTMCQRFDVKEIGYDSYSATWLVTELQQTGVDVVSVSQGAKGMTAPMGETGAAIMKGTMRNPGNACFTWNLGNVVEKRKDAKTLVPAKETNDAKIDAAVALFMALNRA